jgi:hypothetical protein
MSIDTYEEAGARVSRADRTAAHMDPTHLLPRRSVQGRDDVVESIGVPMASTHTPHKYIGGDSTMPAGLVHQGVNATYFRSSSSRWSTGTGRIASIVCSKPTPTSMPASRSD